jgi:hypothetical protein
MGELQEDDGGDRHDHHFSDAGDRPAEKCAPDDVEVHHDHDEADQERPHRVENRREGAEPAVEPACGRGRVGR